MRKRITTVLFAAMAIVLSTETRADNDYMVEKGDTLIGIGKLFGVPYKEIMRVNNLTETTIYVDQILRIPSAGRTSDRDPAMAENAPQPQPQPVTQPEVKPQVVQTSASPASSSQPTTAFVSARQERPTYSESPYIPPVQGKSKARPKANLAPETYTVQVGDSIWSISRKFGISAWDLRKANNIKYSAIRVGQILTLPPAESAMASN